MNQRRWSLSQILMTRIYHKNSVQTSRNNRLLPHLQQNTQKQRVRCKGLFINILARISSKNLKKLHLSKQGTRAKNSEKAQGAHKTAKKLFKAHIKRLRWYTKLIRLESRASKLSKDSPTKSYPQTRFS